MVPRQEQTALLIVDHGSRVEEANDLLRQLAKLLESTSEFSIICHAHMELAAPSISEAFDTCVCRGAKFIIVHPYFLAPGRHSTLDIPRLVEQAAAKHPGVQYRITQPLGLHIKIAELILERVRDACS